jgi:integrase/recombinase XerD
VRDYALLLFYADTGLRLNEALSVRLIDLDMEAQKVKVLGKGAKEREVSFADTTANWLKKWLVRREGIASEWLWVSRYGSRLSDTSVSQRLKKLTRKAGIARTRLSVHALRHFFAIDFLRNGGDAKSLQRILGHSDLSMTMHYVNWAGDEAQMMHRRASPVDKIMGMPAARRVLLR